MMQAELYQYLILYKQLDIPGIGRFELETRSADVDFASRVVNPPKYRVSFRQMNNATPSRKFFKWLEATLNVPDVEAVKRFNDFAFDMRNRLTPNQPLHWEGVGKLKKWLNGEIMFEPTIKEHIVELAVPAKKVIRNKAQHTITVGELEKSSGEMIELLAAENKRKTYWWAIPLVIAVILLAVIAYYFSANGVNISSAGNQQKVTPLESAEN